MPDADEPVAWGPALALRHSSPPKKGYSGITLLYPFLSLRSFLDFSSLEKDAAKGDAMYALFNGHSYVAQKNGRFSITPKLSEAQLWDAPEKASSVLQTPPKLIRDQGYQIADVGEGDVQPVYFGGKQVPDEDMDLDKMLPTLVRYLAGVQALKPALDACYQAISKCDKRQEDLLHRIEFEPMSGGNVAHLGSLLHQCRVQRRAYKDMLEMLTDLYYKTPSKVPPTYLHDKASYFAGRTYTPREVIK